MKSRLRNFSAGKHGGASLLIVYNRGNKKAKALMIRNVKASIRSSFFLAKINWQKATLLIFVVYNVSLKVYNIFCIKLFFSKILLEQDCHKNWKSGNSQVIL